MTRQLRRQKFLRATQAARASTADVTQPENLSALQTSVAMNNDTALIQAAESARTLADLALFDRVQQDR